MSVSRLSSLGRALDALVETVNASRSRPTRRPPDVFLDAFVELLFEPSRRLAVYGSLAPGREHHRRVEGLAGTWSVAAVHGELCEGGWASELGYDALVLDPTAAPVPVWVLTADELKRAWPDLDRFEGPDYLRGLVPAYRDDRLTCVANCYLAHGGSGHAASPP